MDKRSWPWKKKSLEATLESSPNHYSSNQSGEQEENLVESGRISDEAWQHSEEKIKGLNEKLSAALLQISAKEDLVKQHAKVADEAVSGWEKAEAEAIALKKQLDSSIQQKLTLEDRVSHLDGALKECMRQLRHVREEEEKKIHATIVKHKKELDEVRSELERKLEVSTQKGLEAKAENYALSESLIQRSKTLSEVGEAQSRAEAEVKLLQSRLELVEKEDTSSKYEMSVMKKELQIRNEEREMAKRSADVTNKQLLDNAKTIARLEAECHRLRLLVRKKLPGPAALLQMKAEAEALGIGNKKRSGGKGMSASLKSPILSEPVLDAHEHTALEVETLSERLATMEEETKSLKEALVKKNSELQAARLMCAKTASKLSSVEEQLDAMSLLKESSFKNPSIGLPSLHLEASRSPSVTKEPSVASISEDGYGHESCTESWASALITELAQFNKEKGTPKLEAKKSDAHSLDLMDDFIEMERLASLSSEMIQDQMCEKANELSEKGRKEMKDTIDAKNKKMNELELHLSQREEELQVANQLCKEISYKLSLTEEELALLRLKNTENEVNMLNLQERLDAILKAQGEGKSRERDESPHLSVEKLQAHIRQLSRSSHFGDGSVDETESAVNRDISMSMEDGSSTDEEASTSKSGGSEREAARVAPGDVFNKTTGDLSKLKEELRIVKSEKVALESHMRAELARFGGIEDKLARLKSSYEESQTSLRIANEKIEDLKSQLFESEQKIARLQKDLSVVQDLKDSADVELSNVKFSKTNSEDRLKRREDELHRLTKKVAVLEKGISEEQERNEDLNSQLRDLQKQLQRERGTNCSSCAAAAEEAKLSKEREITEAGEKLAECQRTILALGKQLKELASPGGLVEMRLPEIIYSNTEEDINVSAYRDRRAERDLAWNSQDSTSSDVLDCELANLSGKRAQMFGNGSPEHADFIEAVMAQMPSSPETDQPASPRSSKSSTRPLPPPPNPHKQKRKNKSSEAASRSSNDSTSSEKHGSGFSRFFSLTKNSTRNS